MPPPDVLEAEGAVIGTIHVRVGDIFDPNVEEEDGALYQLVNRIHVNTRPGVVSNLLLVTRGETYSQRRIDESERLLRAERIFYDAEIYPTCYRDGVVDLAVDVRDVWTLVTSASFNRAGGKNGTRFELQDANFLGTGKDITLAQRTTVDRTTSLAAYRDHSLFGSRARLETWYADTSDGGFRVFDLRRPFFSLDARWSAGLRVRLEERVDDLYRRGEVSDSFAHDQDFAEAWAGYSKGLVDGRTLRLLVGATYLADRFALAEEEPVPRSVPEDRLLAYPWVGFEWLEDDYRRTYNLDQMARTEDLHLGWRLSGRLGVSSKSAGADRDRVVFGLSGRDGYELGGDKLLLLKGGVSGRWGKEGGENVFGEVAARLYRRGFKGSLFFADLSAAAARNLDGESQLLLGGDSGLRGYPLRYQDGDRRVLLTVEQRFYTPLHLFNVVQVGGAVFADVGRAWFEGDAPPGWEARRDGAGGWLSDVGLGLRLTSSRSGRGTLVHLDVAFPLGGDPSIDGVQWLITTKESF